MKVIPYWGLWSILLCGTVHAQRPDSTFLYLQNPQQVSLYREDPRTQLFSFNKKELALAGARDASTYMQFLGGEWKTKTFTEPTLLDTALTICDASTWPGTTAPERESSSAWATLYRHDFKMPFAWIDREIFIHVGPVCRAYYIYINGHQAGYHEDSKTAAEFDITRWVNEGRNQLSIVAYANPISTTLENQNPAKGTSLSGEVYLQAQPKVRMRDYVIDTRFAPDGTSGLFNFGVIVKSHLLNPKQVTVYYDLYAPDSTLVLSGKRDARFEMRLEDTVRFFANIPHIESWSHESPKLYTVALRIQHEGRFTDYTTLQTGFREVKFSDRGITINGRPVELRGIEYHIPPDEASLRNDLLRFRTYGINLLKVSQYPQQKQFYDLCDRYGFYVCDQANLDTHLSGESLSVGGTPANDTLWEAAYTDRVMNMYHFSKNHPSVIMFSLGKEAGRGYSMYEAYLRLKEKETDRPIIYAGAGAEWNTDMIVGNPQGRNRSDKRFTLKFAAPENWQTTPFTQTSVSVEPIQIEKGKAIIRNGFTLANLTNFSVGYAVTSRGKPVLEGKFNSDIAPKTSAEVEAELETLKPGKYTLTIFVAHKDEVPWAKRGERLVEQSYPLIVPKPPKEKPGK